MSLPAEVQALLDAQPPGRFSAIAEGKVKCELNGHTFPARIEALQAFLNGKKYAKLVAAADLDTQLARYEPFIVRSKNLPGMLFCALTGELLNARLNEVKHHLKGKKFARAKERFEGDEQELLEEPELEGSDMEEDGPEGSDGPGFWVPDEVLQEYEMGDAEAEAEAGAGEAAAAAGAADAGAAEEEQQPAAAAAGKVVKGKGKGKAAAKQQQHEDKPQRQRKGRSSSGAAAENGGTKSGGSKQQAAAGKGKAPKAKKARTG
ncbi:Surfeit locus 2 [Chlorella sorokiniana]|uniref:Surfeit locus 2 n=1 Tax=Chlorella sorokiniana TaxID=3076 RepID=A0A2P6TV15_CHLSO|nr:Surfeit locus 2 [Chlorella sorokiniana]|eukprot:PRW57912.1 Surfeit locus 2 [Chlorella sorokiniana]